MATPLLAWTGYGAYATADIVLGEMSAGERLVSGPLTWSAPASAPFYPRRLRTGLARPTQVFCTDRTLYSVVVFGSDVVQSVQLPYDQLSLVAWRLAWRKNKSGILAKTEQVVLLSFSTSSGEKATWESRYRESTDFVRSLEQAISSHSTGSSTSMGDELAKLSELRSAGVLNDDEWERAKRLWLGKPTDSRAESVALLGMLYELHRKGALSEGEFNMKKWDILAKDSAHH